MEFKPQLALHLYKELDKKRTKVAESVFAIFEKYDGWYGVKRVNWQDLNVQNIMSRKMREIPSMTDFSALMKGFEIKNNIIMDGTIIFEILIKGVPVFSDLNGILNRSKAPCQAQDAYIMVHDLIPNGGEELPFLTRYKLAVNYVKALNMPNVYIAPIIGTGRHTLVQEAAEHIWKLKRKHLSNEGSIGKRVDAPYSCGKRNNDLIKVKCEVTLEALVIGWERGQGKYEGTLGKLIVRTADGTEHSVSGMSDEERDAWAIDFSIIKNKVVELEAMQVLENGSLREGRYKAIRHDKDVNEID